MSEDFEQAIKLLAKMRGVSVDVVKQEMLEKAMGLGGTSEPPRPERAAAMSRVSGDASGADLSRVRAEAVQRHQAQAFPGSPVVRYEGDHRNESPEEAQERWYEEEAELLDGVHGLGGSSAGGIFGAGAIATNIYDPEAMGRADARMSQTATIKVLGLVEKLERRLAESEARAAGYLPGGGQPGGALPGAASRRLGRGKR